MQRYLREFRLDSQDDLQFEKLNQDINILVNKKKSKIAEDKKNAKKAQKLQKEEQ